ncbi:hypothetical protein ABZ949_01930 [Micromonospora tulbaghiae]|uniref:hypothetical protein n=1 Tax=Micromonospora tulbaghiae TaxID=479978 RepID=UPI0033F064C1
MSVPADHPHTDPGDGRTECPTCGKFVWPAIHSCKGVPVTAAARARMEAETREVPADVRELADVIADARMRGIRFGPYTLARAILDAGYRRERP